MSISITRTYVMANAAPLLEGKKLCTFLEKMDEEESSQIVNEEKPLYKALDELDKSYSWKNIFKSATFAALGVGPIVGGCKYSYDHSSLAAIPLNEAQISNAIWSSALNARGTPAMAKHTDQEVRNICVKNHNEHEA